MSLLCDNAANGAKTLKITEYMLVAIDQALAWRMALLIVLELITLFVKSTDSAALIVNAINAASDKRSTARTHIFCWASHWHSWLVACWFRVTQELFRRR